MTCTTHSLAVRPVKAVATQAPHTNESQNLHPHISLAYSFVFWRGFISNQISSQSSTEAGCLRKEKVVWTGPSIQLSEGPLFQAEAPTQLQHHSSPPTSAQQGSPEWQLFMNKSPIAFVQGASCGQPPLQHLWSHCKQPAPTQTPALPMSEASRTCSWLKKWHQEPTTKQMNTPATDWRRAPLPLTTQPPPPWLWELAWEDAIPMLPLTLPTATPGSGRGHHETFPSVVPLCSKTCL